MAQLCGAIDLRRHQPHPADQIGRVVAAYSHGCAWVEFQHMHGRHLGVELDLVVDRDAKHRPTLRRRRRARGGPDFGDETRSRRAQ